MYLVVYCLKKTTQNQDQSPEYIDHIERKDHRQDAKARYEELLERDDLDYAAFGIEYDCTEGVDSVIYNLRFTDLLARNNHYCEECPDGGLHKQWTTWSEFYEACKDADTYRNLIVKWDIRKKLTPGEYYMEIFIMDQQKGSFEPHLIKQVRETDLGTIKELLYKHYQKLQRLWRPFADTEL